MKVLVFGKSGQVATELQAFADVISLGRDQADLGDPEVCARAILTHKVDAVINAAAYTAVDKAEDEEELALVINGEAPAAMARAAAQKGIPFVHISTDYVFSGTGQAPWKVADPVAPANAYGRSKLRGEEGVRAAGGNHAILRTSWVVSAHGNNFVKTMVRLAETRDHLTIVADQIGGPTPARDIAAACMSLVQAMAGGQKGGTYHYSGAPDTSWADFAREIFQQTGQRVSVEDIPTSAYPTPAARPLNSKLDCQALMDDFGILRPDWQAGLKEILKDLANQ